MVGSSVLTSSTNDKSLVTNYFCVETKMWIRSTTGLPREVFEGFVANREYRRVHVGPAFLQGHIIVPWIGIDLSILVCSMSRSHWTWQIGPQNRTPK